jgi:hypothetical protein
MTEFDEQRIAELLHALPPAPEAWVRAAQELPAARRCLDEIAERARVDAEYRRAVIADLQAALEQAGIDPEPRVLDELRARLGRD